MSLDDDIRAAERAIEEAKSEKFDPEPERQALDVLLARAGRTPRRVFYFWVAVGLYENKEMRIEGPVFLTIERAREALHAKAAEFGIAVGSDQADGFYGKVGRRYEDWSIESAEVAP